MIHDHLTPSFAAGPPSNQNMVDIFAGVWQTAFPKECNVEAGPKAYFNDTRVQWTSEQLGGLQNRSVLELGPFEAYNTFHLCSAGADPVVSIEANNINYLKCLIVKEMLGLGAKFRHGNFIPYLESTNERFDLCFASGVLYHMTEPLRLLRGLARVSDAIFIWTHYFDSEVLNDEHASRYFVGLDPQADTFDGYDYRLHPRSYRFSKPGQPPATFSGGLSDYANWISFEDIVGFLEHLGFGRIDLRSREPHTAGPTCSLLARRG